MMRRLLAYLPVTLCMLFFWSHTALFADTPAQVTSGPPAVSSPASPSSPPGTMTPNPAPGPDSGAMTDIIDIKPPEKIGYDKKIFLYLLYALAALALIGLLFYLVDLFIRKRKKSTASSTIVLPPDVIAFQSLGELEKELDMEEREFYFRLTAIVRGYLEGRYGIDALEMTTEELLPRLSDISLEKQLGSGLKDLLKSTDPVKFAGVRTGQDKMKNDLVFAREFVEKTRFVPVDPMDTTDGNGMS